MVEYSLELDNVFSALADPTRRDILRRVATNQLSVGQLATDYHLTFAAVSKHLKVLERARLIVKRRQGRHQFIAAFPAGIKKADDYLGWYRQTWEGRLDRLDNSLVNKKG